MQADGLSFTAAGRLAMVQVLTAEDGLGLSPLTTVAGSGP
jgi:hypothetical protein